MKRQTCLPQKQNVAEYKLNANNSRAKAKKDSHQSMVPLLEQRSSVNFVFEFCVHTYSSLNRCVGSQ